MVISLGLLMMVPAFHLNLIYTLYHFNKTYIAQKYCVNLDQPALMCSGKCYINKVIAQTQDQQSDSPLPRSKDKISVFLFPPPEMEKPAYRVFSFCRLDIPLPTPAYEHLFIPSIFHPPRV